MAVMSGNMCFVLMPFAPEFKNQWELAFRPAIEEAGLAPWRGDEDRLGTNIIMADVTRCIADARLIVADLTHKNPNVMYELGLAHAAKKPVIMLLQEDSPVPFDVSHVRYLKYDKNNLTRLRAELKVRITHTMAMNEAERPDCFPQLKVMHEEDFKELEYLRIKMPELSIKVYPPTADIFFNDRLLGPSPQVVRVNPDAPTNSISASVATYFEFHEELTDSQIQAGTLGIVLEPRDESLFQQRVPRYLRQRRKYPNNPVLMRAVASYLLIVGECEEAIAEGVELLDVAPYWYLSHNQAGFVLPKTHQYFGEAIEHYERVAALRPDLDLGDYNLACTYSLKGEFLKCLEYLDAILDDSNRLKSYCFHPGGPVSEDSDFDPIRDSEQYGDRFRALEQQFRSAWADFEEKRVATRKEVEDFGRNLGV